MPRRVSALVLLASAIASAGCGGAAGLDVNLILDEPVRAAAAAARVIVSRGDGSGFAAAADSTLKPGLTVRSLDADGDGKLDVVIDFTRAYPLRAGSNRFKLVPAAIARETPVRLRVEVLDASDNVVARLADAQMRDWVEALLAPGQVTGDQGGGVALHPVCGGPCTSATRYPAALSVDGVAGAALTALAAGNLTGSLQHRADLAVGARDEDHGGAPAAGHVRVYLGPQLPYPAAAARDLYGAAGDQLGSALAAGDLDGDGKDELVMGARGAGLGAGEVVVLFGASAWWTQAGPLSLDGAGARRFAGAAAGDQLGSALALLDVDGDGKPEIIAGAPGAGGGAGAVWVVRLADLLGAAADGGSGRAAAVVGRAGGQLGRSLAAQGGRLAIAAPLDARGDGKVVGAVYLVSATDLAGAALQAGSLGRWLGEGGGFGAALALASLDGSGLSLAVGAPGAGALLIQAGVSSFAGDLTGASRVVQGAAPIGSLGTAVVRAAMPGGDALVVGAPALLPGVVDAPDAGAAAPPDMAGALGRDPRAGAAFVLRGATLLLANVDLAADGQPAAAASFGDLLGGGYGGLIAVGDLDEDGALDLAIASTNKRSLWLIPGAIK